MSETEQILDVFVETQGWTKNTIIDLCLTYIENQASPEAWRDYLSSLAEVDDDVESVRGCSCGMADYGAPGHDGDPNGPDHDIDVEAPANWDEVRMVFVCERHGGTWGEDETCARCTYEDGTVRPQTDKGPLGPGASV